MTRNVSLLRAIDANPAPLQAQNRAVVERWFRDIHAGKFIGTDEFCSTFQAILARPSSDIWRLAALSELVTLGAAHVSLRPDDIQTVLTWSADLCARDDSFWPWLMRSMLLGRRADSPDEDVIACLRMARGRLDRQPWLFAQVLEAGVALGFVDRRWPALEETVQWAATDEARSLALGRILGWYEVPDDVVQEAVTKGATERLMQSVANWRATH